MPVVITTKAKIKEITDPFIERAVELFNKTEEEVIKAPLSVFSILFAYLSYLSFNSAINHTTGGVCLIILSVIFSTLSIIFILVSWLVRKESVKTLKRLQTAKKRHSDGENDLNKEITGFENRILLCDKVKNKLILLSYAAFIISLLIIAFITIMHLCDSLM